MFRSTDDRVWQQSTGRTAEERFRLPYATPTSNRQAQRIFRQRAVEKRCSHFERRGHRGAVRLCKVIFGKIEKEVEPGGHVTHVSRAPFLKPAVRFRVGIQWANVMPHLRRKETWQQVRGEVSHPT